MKFQQCLIESQIGSLINIKNKTKYLDEKFTSKKENYRKVLDNEINNTRER